MTNTIFYLLAGVIVASAFLAITLRNLFHCALFLAMTMLGVSGVFLYLNSEFLAAVQVLIYVGAVTVLIIFGIMLTRNVMDAKTRVMNHQVILGILVAAAVTVIMIKAVGQSTFQSSDHPTLAMASSTDTLPVSTEGITPKTDVYLLGPELLRPDKGFAFAFELVSVLLLSALIGATVVARKDPE
jgi:NADH:ubiquinone oxidoreductase subunit 6 (subunit J)